MPTESLVTPRSVQRPAETSVGADKTDISSPRANNIYWQAAEIDKRMRARQKVQKPVCLWFTGLPGAGKSTIASILEQRLFMAGRHTYLLDGDNVRHGLNRDLGFTAADRVENIRRVTEVARLLVDAGLVTLVAFISPYREQRALARSRFEPGEFIEIFVDAPLEECERRDPKGLYARARRGELANFTGIDSDYEPPAAPDIHLKTALENPDQCVDRILAFLEQTMPPPDRRESLMVDTHKGNWLPTLLPQAVQLTRDAGSAIMQLYSDPNPAVEYKRDQSPLTHADLVSHRVIVEGLANITPGWPVLSEESPEVPFEQRRAWPRFWLVDPLDGTREFLRRNGEFTVNIALIEDGQPILGVVSAPAMDKLYYATSGTGAWREDARSVAPIRAARNPDDPIRIVFSRSHPSGKEDVTSWAGSNPNTSIVMGSSLKFCLLAEGTADLYPRPGPTMEWDTAAAQCILEAAGGRVTDLHGNGMVYNKPSLLNPGFVARAET